MIKALIIQKREVSFNIVEIEPDRENKSYMSKTHFSNK